MVIPLKKNCSKASTFSIHKKFHPPFASQSLMVLGDGQPQLPDLDFGGFSVAKTQKSQILSEKSLESHTHTTSFNTQIRLRPCFTSAFVNVDFFEACRKNQKKGKKPEKEMQKEAQTKDASKRKER